MIKTKSFHLDPKIYFRLVMKTYFLKRWYFFAACLFLVLANFMSSMKAGFLWLGIFFVYVFYVLLATLRFIQDPKNQGFFSKRYIEFDEQIFNSEDATGTKGKLPWTTMSSAQKQKDCYMLFQTPETFFYVPFTAFEKADDRKKFEKILREHALLH